MRAACAALALAATVGGCGLGEGERTEGAATLTVTRDYGAETLLEATVEDPPASETVLRLLDAEADVETRYGGGFVQSIDGLAGGTEDGRSVDWFFYVNGIESPVGAAEVDVEAGARIWWDHHDWTDVMRVPAVVGSWPEPFATGGADVVCSWHAEVCDDVEDALADAGDPPADADDAERPRVLVGPWSLIGHEPPARTLARSPSRTGVFARFDQIRGDTAELVLYDERLTERERLGAGAGLVASLDEEPDAPTWVVTGTDAEGVASAADLLDEADLENRFAVAAPADGEPIPLPVP